MKAVFAPLSLAYFLLAASYASAFVAPTSIAAATSTVTSPSSITSLFGTQSQPDIEFPSASSTSTSRDGTSSIRLRLKNINRAGTRTPVRFVHYMAGLLSIGLGISRILKCMIFGFQNVQCSQFQLFVEGMCHAATSFFGLWRIDWRAGKEPARRALMAPSLVINMFLWILLYSDYVVPVKKATMSSVSLPIMSLTTAVGVLMPYIMMKLNVPGGKGSKSGAFFDTPGENLIVAFISFVFPIFNVWSTFVWTTMRGAAGVATQQAALSAFPQYGVFMRNAHLGIITLNNIASLVSTFVYYGVITDDLNIKIFVPFVASVFFLLLKSHYTAPWAAVLSPNADPPNVYSSLPIALLSIASFILSKPRRQVPVIQKEGITNE